MMRPRLDVQLSFSLKHFPVSKSHRWRKLFCHLSIPLMMPQSVELLTSGMASHRMAPSVMFFKNDYSSISLRAFYMGNLMEDGKTEEVWPVTIKTNIPEQTTTKEDGFCFFLNDPSEIK